MTLDEHIVAAAERAYRDGEAACRDRFMRDMRAIYEHLYQREPTGDEIMKGWEVWTDHLKRKYPDCAC